MIKTSEIKYIGLDLDGTLLNSNKIITDETIHLLKSIHSKGINIILVSGRHFREMEQYGKLLELHNSDYMISCDGQYIFDYAGTLIFKFPFLSKKDLKQISDIYKNTVCYFYTDKEDYAYRPSLLNRICIRCRNFYEGRSSKNMISDIVSQVNEGIEIEKIRVASSSRKTTEMLNGLFNIHSLSSSNKNFEVQSSSVNKYNALLKLQEITELELNHLLYFGNDYNDYECFKYLPHTVSMADSPEQIKALATEITDDCNNLGVFITLSKLYSNI